MKKKLNASYHSKPYGNVEQVVSASTYHYRNKLSSLLCINYGNQFTLQIHLH